MLHLDLRVDDIVEIDNGRIVVRVESKSGQKTRLAFDAPADVKIRRVAFEERSGQPGFRKFAVSA